MEFHTYKPKQERSFKVVLKHMHHSTHTEDIKKALEELGHIAINIWNIEKQGIKEAPSMFYVELKSDNNNKNLLDKFAPPV